MEEVDTAPEVRGARAALAWLHARLPARTLRFLAVGAVSFLLDITLLYLFHGVVRLDLAAATLIAFCVTLVFNFLGQGRWVFGALDRAHVRLVRYLVMVAVNTGITVGVVVGLTMAGMFYLLAKVVAAAIVAAMNYVAYRFWVFRGT